MKKNILLSICAIIFACCAISFIFGKYIAKSKMETNLYPKTGVVYYVDHSTDIILIEDFFGELWLYEGADDWMEGDICAMIMDNNGTEEIKDDEIMTIRYDGWVE